MNLAQKAVLQAAKDAGALPMEQSAEFMLHDLVQACINAMRRETEAYNDLSEQQQDAVNAKLQSDLKETVYTAARILAGADVIEVPVLLQKFDAGKEIKITGIIASDDPGRYQLMDLTHKKQKAIILLHDMNYFQGLDNIQSDKDQKPLDLDNAAPETGKGGKGKAAPKVTSPTSAKAVAAKPIEIPEKLLADAIEFVQRNQVCAVSSFQNGLKVGAKKAEAVQLKLAELGHIALDADGVYQIARSKPAATGSGTADDSLSFEGDDEPKVAATLTDELYASIRSRVIADGRVSVGALSVAFDLETDLVEEAIQRLEDDSVISAEDEETGAREVLQLAE